MSKKLEESIPGHPLGEFIEEFNTKPEFDADGVQVSSGIGLDGKEYADPIPLEPPIGFQAPPDLMTLIKTMVHHEEFNRRLDAEGFDTFEEAGDYDTGEDGPDPLTPHEALFYPPEERSPAAAAAPTKSEPSAPASDPPAPAETPKPSTST